MLQLIYNSHAYFDRLALVSFQWVWEETAVHKTCTLLIPLPYKTNIWIGSFRNDSVLQLQNILQEFFIVTELMKSKSYFSTIGIGWSQCSRANVLLYLRDRKKQPLRIAGPLGDWSLLWKDFWSWEVATCFLSYCTRPCVGAADRG